VPDYHSTTSDCIAQWQHNRRLLSKLEPEFNDWIITITFYAALHAVEALLIADLAPGHSRHGERHETLQNNPRYRSQIWPAYKVAYDLAHVARYSAKPHRWLSAANIPKTLFERSLYPIEAEVSKLLQGRKNPIACPPCPPIALVQTTGAK
jgi:hypothetical protein